MESARFYFNRVLIAEAEFESKVKKGPFREKRSCIKINPADAQIGASAHSNSNNFHLVYEGNPFICPTLIWHISSLIPSIERGTEVVLM